MRRFGRTFIKDSSESGCYKGARCHALVVTVLMCRNNARHDTIDTDAQRQKGERQTISIRYCKGVGCVKLVSEIWCVGRRPTVFSKKSLPVA